MEAKDINGFQKGLEIWKEIHQNVQQKTPTNQLPNQQQKEMVLRKYLYIAVPETVNLYLPFYILRFSQASASDICQEKEGTCNLFILNG